MKKPVCKKCKSDDVGHDAIVRFDPDRECWYISGIFDDAFCDNCDNEGDNILEWVEVEATDERETVDPSNYCR